MANHANEFDVSRILEQTARNLIEQSQILRRQAEDLLKDSRRLRSASQARRAGRKKASRRKRS